MPLGGSIVALVTPWNNDKVDDKALAGLIDWHISQGTAGIVPCGTTGESATYTHDEQAAMIARVVQLVRGRIPVIAGAGSNSTREAVALSVAAEKAGVDAVLTITPYYNKPNQEGLFRHFKAVREATQLPLVLYNVPGRTGVNLLPETVVRTAALGGVDSVKEASGNLVQAQDILDQGVRVLSGEDGLTWPLMALGASGVISVVANFAPRQMADLCAAAAKGDVAAAQKAHKVIHELAKVAFCDTNPIPAKAALHAMGKVADEFRLPLVPLDGAKRANLLNVLRKHGILGA